MGIVSVLAVGTGIRIHFVFFQLRFSAREIAGSAHSGGNAQFRQDPQLQQQPSGQHDQGKPHSQIFH